MSLPLLEGEYAKLIPQKAILRDTVVSIEGIQVTGTGYPYYGWLSSRGVGLAVNAPRHPPGNPVSKGRVAHVFYSRLTTNPLRSAGLSG